MIARAGVAAAVLFATGCAGGGAEEPRSPEPVISSVVAPTPTSNAAAAAAAADADERVPLPTDCDPASPEGLCVPPLSFVKRLCRGLYPDVALKMFGKESPWTRRWLRGDVEAWNASGGLSSTEKLVFDEEVLVMSRRVQNKGAMQVSGSGGGYDVLRWDGSCASLADGEITSRAPPRSKHAKIPWRNLGEPVRRALLADPKILERDEERRKQCKGLGDVSKPCVKAEAQLTTAIVDYVRKGGAVPDPERAP